MGKSGKEESEQRGIRREKNQDRDESGQRKTRTERIQDRW